MLTNNLPNSHPHVPARLFLALSMHMIHSSLITKLKCDGGDILASNEKMICYS